MAATMISAKGMVEMEKLNESLDHTRRRSSAEDGEGPIGTVEASLFI